MDETAKAPWHLWAIGTVALLWYAAGTFTIFMAQAGRLDVTPDEAAYYAAQPGWFIAVTDIALFAGIGGSILLLMCNAKAGRVFALSLGAIIATHAYDLWAGTSRSFANAGAMTVNILIVVIAVLLIWYAARMAKRGVLR